MYVPTMNNDPQQAFCPGSVVPPNLPFFTLSRGKTKLFLLVRVFGCRPDCRVDALQIPLVVTAKTEAPATRSCRPDVATVSVAAATDIVPQAIVVAAIAIAAAVAMEHHYDVFGDGDGSSGLIDDSGSGEQAIVVDNTSGSPTFLYSNARRFATRWFYGFVAAADSLATTLGRRR